MTISAERRPVRRALIAVSDKSGLADLAAGLHAVGVEIVSTGGTARTIASFGVPVTPVEAVTGFPEVLDGRVKTLHPAIHAGLLADLTRPDHEVALRDLDIAAFELLIVNLYPFAETVRSGASVAECVEQIDIGGPAMVRAAAKNYGSVAVIVRPDQYSWVLEQVQSGGFTHAERSALAVDAFRHTATYDVAVASWLADAFGDATVAGSATPEWIGAAWQRKQILRYGENPHQQAAVYTKLGDQSAVSGVAGATQLHGKEMSYNNFVDADAAWRAAWDHELPCVAIIKHTNPCGIAVSYLDGPAAIAQAHRKAHACDPVSAFGGVIAVNRDVTLELAEQISEIFTEVVIAPGYADGATELLSKKKNIRILTAPAPNRDAAEMRVISGGLLVQTADTISADGDDPAKWTLACGAPLTESDLADALFAWRAVRAVKSNAILLASDGATVGIGMGQVNRVDAARLAVSRAGERARNSIAASDAFFPFPDGLEVLIEAGITAAIQPGGSVRDAEVIATAAAAGITLYLTGARHFAH